MFLKKLMDRGIRITIKAEELLKNTPYDEKILREILELKKEYLNEEDISKIIEKESEKIEQPIIVKRSSVFKPIAKEYSAKIEITTKENNGSSTTKGGIEDFIQYFRSRYSKLYKLLKKTDPKYPEEPLIDIKKRINENVRIIVMVTSKQETKNKNLLLEVEDLTGSFKVVIGRSKEKLFEYAQGIMLDDVVAIRGKVLEAFLIADDLEWPDLPVTRERKIAENDLAIAYLSDLHFGSNNFLEEHFEKFISWIKGENGAEELASKLKYIIIAGDIVDGIGIYPNQEKELLVSDVYKQYELFNDFVERVPEYIEILAIPGNHDAVRRGEPCPALEKELVSSEIISLSNPSTAIIEGLKHVLYHGTSMDSMISNLAHLSYKKPEKVMEEYLRRRHLSPIYGGNLIIPEKSDHLVLEEEPDVLHTGHIHKNGYGFYRGTLLINSGTFQARTEYQVKQGHMPTPAIVPVYELKSQRLKTLNFMSG